MKVSLTYCSLLIGISLINSMLQSHSSPKTKKSELSHQILMGQLDMQSISSVHTPRALGFTNRGTIDFLVAIDVLRDQGFIAQYNPQKHLTTRLSLSKWVYGYHLYMPLFGDSLVTTENAINPSFHDTKPHTLTILSSTGLYIKQKKSFGPYKILRRFFSVPNDSNHLILATDSTSSNKISSSFGGSNFEWLNWKTGKIDKSLTYEDANHTSKLLVSPSKKYLVALFYSDSFSPYGISNYSPQRDKLDRESRVVILDYQTGRILWEIDASLDKPAGDPLFFISPTQFISSDTLFDISKKTATHWSAITSTIQCLATVPGHASDALFLTPHGLELHNWRTNKTLVTWATIKKSGHILFSPDLKTFSFQHGSIIQFWRFNPKWLS